MDDRISAYQTRVVARLELELMHTLHPKERDEIRDRRDAMLNAICNHIGIRIENNAVVGVAGVGVYRYHDARWTSLEMYPYALLRYAAEEPNG